VLDRYGSGLTQCVQELGRRYPGLRQYAAERAALYLPMQRNHAARFPRRSTTWLPRWRIRRKPMLSIALMISAPARFGSSGMLGAGEGSHQGRTHQPQRKLLQVENHRFAKIGDRLFD
jgi:hypothetical protein